MQPPPIGGFFELDLGPPLDARQTGRSVAMHWFGAASQIAAFHNARSALAFGILPALSARTLWLPAFLCADLTRAAATRIALRRYKLAVSGPLDPDTEFLDSHVEPGDTVLVVSYFGRPPSAAFRAYAASRLDITWLEDRAGALDPGPAWGDILLYSPRKLLGVPDGGFAVVPAHQQPRPLEDPADRPQPVYPPSLARFEDPDARRNAEWYGAYRAAERAMVAAPLAATRLTTSLLARIDIDEAADRRHRNHKALLAALPAGTALDGFEDPADWVPQGLPVLVPNAPSAVAAMARARVFCPHLWPDIPEDDLCSRTAELRDRLILLPCDHRYAPEDMARVAAAFCNVLAPA